jgi:hypothetical protein
LGDVDGDGSAELVGRKGGAIIACDFNLKAYSWAPHKILPGAGVVPPPDTTIAVADLDGDGLDDFFALPAHSNVEYFGQTTQQSNDTVTVTWTVDREPPTV